MILNNCKAEVTLPKCSFLYEGFKISVHKFKQKGKQKGKLYNYCYSCDNIFLSTIDNDFLTKEEYQNNFEYKCKCCNLTKQDLVDYLNKHR